MTDAGIARSAQDDDVRLVRALLRARAADAVLQDQIDCAELAFNVGRRDLAATLVGACCLRMGFSASAWASLAAASKPGELWPDFAPPAEIERVHTFSVDRAVAELAHLLTLCALSGLPLNATADRLATIEMQQLPYRALAIQAETASHILRQVPLAAADHSLARLLLGVRQDVATLPPIRLDEHLDLPLQSFAALYALEQLRRFLVTNAELLDGEETAPGLFDAALRLSPAGLGPFFSNLPMLIRNARDIFAMINLASDRKVRQAELATWCVLLSAHLPQHHLLDLVDELGDRGMTFALEHLLARAARADGPHYPAEIVWRIRDACLDIGEYEIAADAQQLISLWRPHDVNEWRILAHIRAALSDAIGVEGALDHAASLRPNDPETSAQMAAWKAGLLRPIERGYSTSPGRRRLRLARVSAYRATA